MFGPTDDGPIIEEQINGVLCEHEAGAKAAELCRKHGISEATFYNWTARYGAMEVSEAKRLKALEYESATLKNWQPQFFSVETSIPAKASL